jgi:cell division protein FtsB
MKHHHPTHHATPKRSRAKKRRVHYQPPREETPFSKPSFLSSMKRQMRLVDAVYLVITVMAGSALLGLCHNSFATYLTTRSMLKEHTAQLDQLQTREASLHQRLAELKSPDGRDQLLRERGFVQGNERILLFADDAQPADNGDTVAQNPQANLQPVSANKTSFWGGIAKAIDHAADRPAVH